MELVNKTLKAEVFCAKGWIGSADQQVLDFFFIDLLNLSKFIILNKISHQFENGAFTSVWLLAESHLALHSFEEEGTTYFELTSCSESKMCFFTKHLSNSDFKYSLEVVDNKKDI